MLQNFKCKPGSYAEIVPLGLLCTLQYNSNGVLQKIIKGFNHVNHTDAEVFEPALTIKLKEKGIVPTRIQFNQGTTWVKGVFYSVKLFKTEGIFPDCVQNDILKDLIANPEEYVFYAGHLHNDLFSFGGGQIVATRLSTFGFNVLPGYNLYDDTQVIPVSEIMRIHKSPFVFPLLSGVMVYENVTNFRFIPSQIAQCTVESVSTYYEDHGFIRAHVQTTDGNVLDVPYSEIVRYSVTPKSIILVDDNDIIHSRKGSTLFNTKVSNELMCPVCGKKIQVPLQGYTHCADAHCPSRIYPALKHFIDVLKLPDMDFETFKHHVDAKEITCLLDIFSLSEYENTQVKCTLSNLLFAITPFDVCRSVEFFQKFTHYLGSVEALDSYLQDPDTILTDLNLNPMYAPAYVQWLKDPMNLLQVKTVLSLPQIQIVSIAKKFNGAPIFRNKTICVTGKFLHGTIEDVISILQSYSARVVTAFDNTVNCVLVGHFECEDPQITALATSYGVPIYGEDSFFKSYEIDQDIKKQRDMLSSLLH